MTSCGIIAINLPSMAIGKINNFFPKILNALKNHQTANYQIKKLRDLSKK